MKTFQTDAIIKELVQSLNDFDVAEALTLFTTNAIIDDVSVGAKFQCTEGVRKYLETFFVSYKTVTKIVSIEEIHHLHTIVQVDFTGDFGHETSALNLTLNNDGLITIIKAHLD